MTTGFRATDREIRGVGEPAADGAIELGTVEEADGSHFDRAPGRPTYVKVRLFRGNKPLILCRIAQPLNHIPTPGTQVMVAVPAGFGYTPGCSAIFCSLGAEPANQYSEEKAKLDFGPDFDLVIKARSITLTDYENRYLTIGPIYGVKIGDETASGACLKDNRWLFYAAQDEDAKAVLELSTDKVRLLHKDDKQTSLVMQGGKFCVAGETFQAACSAGYLGAFANVATGIAYSVAGPANAVSTSWYVSPT